MRQEVAVVLTAVIALGGCDRGEPGRIPPSPEAVEVLVSHPAAIGGTATFAATVRAVERAELATRISGAVVRVAVDVGSAVARGDVLVALDGSDVEARIRGAGAELERARRAFGRMESLHADGAATDQELDDARAFFEVAEAALEEARAQRGYTLLRAPFSGVVTVRSVDPGDLAVPGRPVLTLAGSSALEAVADLPASWEGRVAVGDTLELVRPETGERTPVRVARLAPAVETSSRRFRLEATLPVSVVATRGLRPGAFVRLELPDPGRYTLWVPSDAVVRRGQLAGVFTVERDSARLRWIRPGLRREEAVEVLAGLSTEDAVVRRPPPGLRDGEPVSAVREVPFAPTELEDPAAAEDAGAAEDPAAPEDRSTATDPSTAPAGERRSAP